MNKLLALIICFCFLFFGTAATFDIAEAKGRKSVRVKSYTKKSGARVVSHKRSLPSKR